MLPSWLCFLQGLAYQLFAVTFIDRQPSEIIMDVLEFQQVTTVEYSKDGCDRISPIFNEARGNFVMVLSLLSDFEKHVQL